MYLTKCIFTATLCLIGYVVVAQKPADYVDTTKAASQDLLSVMKKFKNLKISGYIQPEYQIAESKGQKSFAGGDFPATVDNRFILRRMRVKFDYSTLSDHKTPQIQFLYQIDASERSVAMRDLYGRIYENKYDLFSLQIGSFVKPFGNELPYSSSDRESPERGRMSQTVLKGDRDLGAILIFNPQKKDNPYKNLQVDMGFFNGPGLVTFDDYDSYKDFLIHAKLKDLPLSKNATLSVGASYMDGGIGQNNKTIYKMTGKDLDFTATTDSLQIGSRSPRVYYGADAQLKIKSNIGTTELRAEYIAGTHSATATSSDLPQAVVTDPLYVRSFNGAYFYFIQSFAKKHQVIVKYDWYDPNTNVVGDDIKAGTKLTAADIKYSTLGLGYIYYMNDNLKAVFWYDIVKNETTQLTGFTSDLNDNVFTCRLQYRF